MNLNNAIIYVSCKVANIKNFSNFLCSQNLPNPNHNGKKTKPPSPSMKPLHHVRNLTNVGVITLIYPANI